MSRALELLKTMHRSAISTAPQLSTTTLSSRRRDVRRPPTIRAIHDGYEVYVE